MHQTSGRFHTDDRDDVDPQLRLFMQRMAAAYAAYPALDTLPLAEVRRITGRVREQWVAGGPAMAETDEFRVGAHGVRVRMLYPRRDARLPVLVYLHGGGWTLFDIDTHDRVGREYAARADVAVAMVDYSLAPEHRFPRALEETLDAVAWLREEEAALGIDAARIAIGGDSAGANLAVASQLRMRAQGQRPLSAMLLNYGAYSDEPSSSWTRYDGPGYMLEAGEMKGFWNNYLRSAEDRDDPLAMPLRADLRGLPPAFMAIAECDILVDGNLAMADALRAAGVAVEAHTYAGATHSFLEAMSISTLADRAIDDGAGWLQRMLARP
jgi:acetyl esterase